MAQWIILKTPDGSEYLNLEMASRIIHHVHEDTQHDEYIVEFGQSRVIVKNEYNPATFAHIAAYLGETDFG